MKAPSAQAEFDAIYKTTPRQHQSNVLAAGCLISVMAILYTSIGFVIGYVIGRL
jgi:hypothetical protein